MLVTCQEIIECASQKRHWFSISRVAKRGNQLWCEGIIQSEPSLKRKRSNDSIPVVIPGDSSNSDDDIQPPPQKQKPKRSALDEKAERVQKLADELRAKHGDTYNRIQYKLWAEAMDVNKQQLLQHGAATTRNNLGEGVKTSSLHI